jgi:hypothetical protein
MSPRLLYLLTTLRTHPAFESERDRVEAQRAAIRMRTHVGVLS